MRKQWTVELDMGVVKPRSVLSQWLFSKRLMHVVLGAEIHRIAEVTDIKVLVGTRTGY